MASARRSPASAEPPPDGEAPPDVPEVTHYLAMLRDERKLAEHTLTSYRRDLHTLVRLAAGRPLAALGYADIRRFAMQLHAQGLVGRSIARTLSAWRGFYEWLARHAALAANPVAGVRAPKQPKPLPKALPVEQAVALAEHCGGGDPLPLRNHAMFELLYSSGLRLSELVSLDVAFASGDGHVSRSWLNLPENEVVVTGKGGKMRSVPVGSRAAQALAAWLAVRAQLGGARADPHALFLSARGTRLGARAVQQCLRQHAVAAGLPTHVHPHMLRHSFASHVLQSSGDLRAVQEMLGHANIATTQIYTKLDFMHLAKVYDQAHPRAKRKAKGD